MPENVDKRMMADILQQRMGGGQPATRNLWREMLHGGTPQQRHVFSEEIIRQVPEAAVPIPRPDLLREMTFDDSGELMPTPISPQEQGLMLKLLQQYMRREHGADTTII